ncbi:MAG: helix-turn-helix transcriptional regulator [Bacillota bacterium]|nr:helix-turn-helix transcriptional regulator [Bacillota bacterium]
MMIHEEETNAFYRMVDIAAWLFTKYFWYMFILECTVVTDKAKRRLKLFIRITLIPLILISVFNYGHFMDGYYFVESASARKFVLTVQFISVCTTLAMNVFFFVIAHRHCYYASIRKLIYFMTAILVINGAWNGFITLFLVTGQVKHIAWDEIFDPTAVFFLAINMLLFLLVKQYFEIEETKNVTGERIAVLSKTFDLTGREREVAEYLYKGLTYAAIADELIISKYTVKRHVHNLYEKLDVESKNQFLELVNKE